MSDEREIAAAEYVLGTLHADERTLFSSALANDAEARDAVAAWEKRLAPLRQAVDEIAPPAEVWERIEDALPPTASAAVIDSDHDDDVSNVTTLRRTVSIWRGAALSAGALAAGLALLTLSRELTRHPALQSSYVAVVNRGGDLPALVVRVDLADGTVYVRPVAAQTPAGKSLELWYIGEGKAPKSMGVISDAAAKMPLPAGLSTQKTVFAVTLEPQGGSPTGDPTGPVVYSGQLIKE
ncbi:anti-sigma factor [Methylocella silvestris]|nr:anti-sigma factor [Methylocella silvestris]